MNFTVCKEVFTIAGDAKVAAQSLEEMLRESPDLRTLAQLVLAYAKFDLKQVIRYLDKQMLEPYSSGMQDLQWCGSGGRPLRSRAYPTEQGLYFLSPPPPGIEFTTATLGLVELHAITNKVLYYPHAQTVGGGYQHQL